MVKSTEKFLFGHIKSARVERKSSFLDLLAYRIRVTGSTEKISDTLLHRCFEEINKQPIMWSYDYLRRCNVTRWMFAYFLPMFGLLYAFGIVLGEAANQSRYYITNENFPAVFTVFVTTTIYGPMMIVGFSLTVVLVPICCRRKKRDLNIQRKLWTKFGHEFIDSRSLVLFSRQNNKPVEFLVHVIRSRSIPLPDTCTLPEVWVDDLIYNKLGQLIEDLADNFDSLPEAPYQRHMTKKGKKCICQILENEL